MKNFKFYINNVLVALFLAFSFQSVFAQGECSLEALNNELISKNSDKVFKHFEANPEQAYDAWKVLFKADNSAERLNVSILQELQDYISTTSKDLKVLEDEIKLAGSYTAWKTANSSTVFVKLISGQKASLDIPWKNIDQTEVWFDGGNVTQESALTFANKKSSGEDLIDLVINNDVYIKFNKEDGVILLADTDGKYYGFGQIDPNEYNSIKQTFIDNDEAFKSYLIEKADQLQYLSGKKQKTIQIAGQNVNFSTDKTISILGRFNPDIRNLFTELGSFKNIGLGETPGGINLLNRPDGMYDPNTWWDIHNQPWLDNAINRGDDIYLATIPTKADDLIDEAGNLKGAYAEEINHLVNKGYKPKNVNQTQWDEIKAWFKGEVDLSDFDDYPNIKLWLNGLGSEDNIRLIQNIQRLPEEYLVKLDSDIVNPKYTIKELITDKPNDLIEIWKKLHDEPGYAWEIRKSSPQWEKWSDRQFFKDMTFKGKFFEEETVLLALKNKNAWYNDLKNKVNSHFGKNLEEYDLFKQVQLKYDNEDYFIADQVFAKFTTDQNGKDVIDDIIVIENKLKQTTLLTVNQEKAKSISSYTVRSNVVNSEYQTRNILQSGNILNFDGEIKWFKIYDSENGEEISGIKKLN